MSSSCSGDWGVVKRHGSDAPLHADLHPCSTDTENVLRPQRHFPLPGWSVPRLCGWIVCRCGGKQCYAWLVLRIFLASALASLVLVPETWVGWQRSVVVSTLALINVVNQRWARLLLEWVMSWYVPTTSHLGQLSLHPSRVGKTSTGLCGWG